MTGPTPAPPSPTDWLTRFVPLSVFVGKPTEGEWEYVLWMVGKAWVAR